MDVNFNDFLYKYVLVEDMDFKFEYSVILLAYHSNRVEAFSLKL